MAIIKYDGANSIVSVDGGNAVRADLTGGKLNIKSPIFKGDTITGSYMSKHPNPRGVDINKVMADLEATKADLVGVRSLTNASAAFSREMNELSAIYPQLQRDLRNMTA